MWVSTRLVLSLSKGAGHALDRSAQPCGGKYLSTSHIVGLKGAQMSLHVHFNAQDFIHDR